MAQWSEANLGYVRPETIRRGVKVAHDPFARAPHRSRTTAP